MKTANFKPRCHAPWQQLVIDAAGVVQPCAYRGTYTNIASAPLGNVNDQSIPEIWNGEEARKLRRNMACGDLEAAGCSNCLAIKQNQPLHLLYDEDYLKESPLTSEYAKNIDLKRKEVSEGQEVLKSQPSVLYFTPSHRCNLRCSHCYQNLSRTLEIGRNEVKDEVMDLVPCLTDIVAGGGEPLVMPFWREFIKTAYLKNPYLRFMTTTNATVLHSEVLEGLKNFKRIYIIVSLDGTSAEVFDNIRGKGKFSIVNNNINTLKNLVRGKRDSWLLVNFSVMKDNILDLPNLVSYCSEKAIGYNLQPVVSFPAKQSLRCFNNISEAGLSVTLLQNFLVAYWTNNRGIIIKLFPQNYTFHAR